ncbi:D-alanyl-D-alanine carboxypeptidase/D-alanyl-D-alanine-endopeptidase [Shewanella pneumatophori]|uniref:D-alanyl-D-alanine carboxypeptidase/D-alanyl-D-alanine-endopeptidase n=1 Tax=Shewanella pneumatophori TaxID=314092 RepID=A0A9X1ZDB2_9GAMM|nr:D-alanyl-D-alanine carboxypeptidase/D-alanyl-D-alanine-endopeptidase [Shewanella pneumatophori]MCL1137260.1 D-alanyl-D-alanine carboxypeptidase/D-alanyl-D-alanine-endopeptidase [Shewanella pneumatophori]
MGICSFTPRIFSTLLAVCLAPSISANEYLTNMMAAIAPETSQTAVIVGTEPDGAFRVNDQQLFTPASTMKLLTAVAATQALGENYTFKTQIDSYVSIANNRIEGDLFIRFDGDPTLSSRDLNRLLKQLKSQGLEHIDGNVYLVGNQQEALKAPGWVWDDLGICYAAPVSRYVINHNCINAKLEPRLADDLGKLTYDKSQPVTITSTAVFDKTATREFCELELDRSDDNQFSLSGCFPSKKPLKLAIAISDPALYAQNIISGLLELNEISIKGEVLLTNKRPANTLLIAEHQSKPLNTLVGAMLLHSDNLIADSLLKRMGQVKFGVAGSFTNGSKAMISILTKLGINLESANIVDGSGLSRYNLLSANQLYQVLQLIKSDKRFNHLVELLPIAGETGTLQYRKGYRSAPLKGHIFAKTGSMLGAVNLAGFIKGKDFDYRPFVILENGHSPAVKQKEIAPFSVLLLQAIIE